MSLADDLEDVRVGADALIIDSDDGEVDAAYEVDMSDHKEAAGMSPEMQVATTKIRVKRKREMRLGPESRWLSDIQPKDEAEVKIIEEARKFVIDALANGSLKPDPQSKDVRLHTRRSLVFREIEDRLIAWRSKQKNVTPVAQSETKVEVEKIMSKDDFGSFLDLDAAARPQKATPVGTDSPIPVQLGLKRKAPATPATNLGEIFKIPGLSQDVENQKRYYLTFKPENPADDEVTIAAHWIEERKQQDVPVEMLIVVDLRDVVASEPVFEVLDVIASGESRVYYLEILDDSGKRLSSVDTTVLLPVGSIQFGVFLLILVPLSE